MTWNHRVVRLDRNGNVSFGIHEAYSSDKREGMIGGITEDAVAVVADDVDGLRWKLERMLECLDKPVVDYDNATESRME